MHRLLLRLLYAGLIGATLAPPASLAVQEHGAIVLVGGILRYDNRQVWERIIELAGGTGAQFVVLPAATGRPQTYGAYAVRALERHGAFAELLPVAPEADEIGVDYRKAVQDPELLAKVRSADGVFFTGGAPQYIAQTLYRADGSDTPLLAAIREVYAAGGVIAGANAGGVAVNTGIDALQALHTGVTDPSFSRGLGLLSKNWLIDQHFFTHGRFALSLVAMHKLGIDYGLGVGVDAAVVIRDGKQAEVIGDNGAMVVDLSRAQIAGGGTSFKLNAGRLGYLGDGDHFNLETLQLIPAAAKLDGFEVDPRAADNDPWFAGASFYPDIFADGVLVKLLFSALDGSEHTGVGLAFAEDAGKNDLGFRFHFYPGADSFGWFSGSSQRDEYTVSNVYFDVFPVTRNKIFGTNP